MKKKSKCPPPPTVPPPSTICPIEEEGCALFPGNVIVGQCPNYTLLQSCPEFSILNPTPAECFNVLPAGNPYFCKDIIFKIPFCTIPTISIKDGPTCLQNSEQNFPDTYDTLITDLTTESFKLCVRRIDDGPWSGCTVSVNWHATTL